MTEAITPTAIATLATGDAIEDLRNLLFSLELFNTSPPRVYLLCDDVIANARASGAISYKGELILDKDKLARYSGLTRQKMEAMPGTKYPSLWFEFMAEKITLLRWAFEREGTAGAAAAAGILFCDADICFMDQLPKIPAGKRIALCPHYIRPLDEARYGHYNGGFFWLSSSESVDAWERACLRGQRFYEQSALEDLSITVKPEELHTFSRNHNYGWWRLFQSPAGTEETQKEWSMNRVKAAASAGLLVGGEPVGSVHTHFMERKDRATMEFNQFILQRLHRLAGTHEPARRLFGFLMRGTSPRPAK
jgi:hypothetical protein